MILQVGTFLVAFIAILNTVDKLSRTAKLVLAIISAVVTFIPAAVQTFFAISSMFHYDNGPWKYIRDGLLKSLLLDEYAGYMQRVNVATGGKNLFSYSDPFTGLYQQFYIHREYSISMGPPYAERQGSINLFAENWLEPDRVHNVNGTAFSIRREGSDMLLRIQFRTKTPKLYNLGDVTPNIEEKLKRSLAFMVWCFANSNRVVESVRPQDGIYRAVGIFEAINLLKDDNKHLVERVMDNGGDVAGGAVDRGLTP